MTDLPSKASSPLPVKPGVTLLVGQTNVGNSALLRAFRWRLPDQRHRNDRVWQTERLQSPRSEYVFTLSPREIVSIPLDRPGLVRWPIDGNAPNDTVFQTIISSPSLVRNEAQTP